MMKWIIKTEHHGMLIRDYLQKVHNFSSRILKTVKLGGGEINVNGLPQTVRYSLMKGDMLEVQFPPEKIGPGLQPVEMNLNIIYEDDDLIVIDKRAGIATVPSVNHPSGTVADGMLAYYEKNNIPYTIHIVTRLDRDTSGLVLIAKHSYSHSLLAASQQASNVKRKYKAIIEGHLDQREGTINAPIGRKEGSIIERAVLDTGKRSVTHYKVISKFRHHSLIEVDLETGRTHQIRVHFSHIGHPLAGDNLYGGSAESIGRQALHCDVIEFEHPTTKEIIQLQSELPADMNVSL